jgi:hypothetical protein
LATKTIGLLGRRYNLAGKILVWLLF